MVNTSLTSNTATKTGGALYAAGNSSVHAESCIFEGNLARESHGGGVILFDAASLWLNNVVIRANKATHAGGIGAKEDAALQVVASNFTNNTAVRSGGAVYVDGHGSMSATACSVVDNTAGEDGAGVYAADAASLTVSHSVASFNRVVGKGGAMFLSGPLVKVKLQSCTCTSNVADTGGALLVGESTYTSATTCVFHNNTAGTKGGAIAMADLGRLVLTGKTQGVGNRANFGGFLEMIENSHAVVLGASFAGNTATKVGMGGCVHASGRAVAVMRDSKIVGGEQQRGSGGGFAFVESATLYVSACTLSHLHADKGAGIYVSDSSSLH
jgi:predicted outer membrane repeat protein